MKCRWTTERTGTSWYELVCEQLVSWHLLIGLVAVVGDWLIGDAESLVLQLPLQFLTSCA